MLVRHLPRFTISILAATVAVLAGGAGAVQAAPSGAAVSWPLDGLHWLGVAADPEDSSRHKISFAYVADGYVIRDSAGISAPTPSPPAPDLCSEIDPTTVRCEIREDLIERIRVYGGAGSDTLDLRGAPSYLTELWSRRGDDLIRTGGVEGRDFTRAYAGPDDDHLVGGDGRDRLWGKAGDDVIETGSGAPLADSGSLSNLPENLAFGGPGNDRIFGGPRRDWLRGQSGRDYVVGRRGRDQLDGGPGNDTINSRDGRRDGISCGAGNRKRQAAIRDRHDKLAWFPRWLPPAYPRINC